MGRHRVKPIKPRGHYNTVVTQEMPPHLNLALTIVSQAVRDGRRVVAGTGVKRAPQATRFELINFFRSQWCGVLLGCTELTGEELIERIGLYDID